MALPETPATPLIHHRETALDGGVGTAHSVFRQLAQTPQAVSATL